MSAPRSGIPWATAVSPVSSFAGPAVYVTAAFNDMENIPVISFLFHNLSIFFTNVICPAGDAPLRVFFVIFISGILVHEEFAVFYLFTGLTSVGLVFLFLR